MRLTVSDGSLTDFDDMVVHVFAPGAPRTVNIPIRVGGDDAQEQIGTTSNGFTDLESADDELGNTNNTDATRVMTGLRFTDLPIKAGSTIDDARIQFSVDEVNSSAASYEIRGQLAGNAPPFLQGNQVADGSKKTSRTAHRRSPAWPGTTCRRGRSSATKDRAAHATARLDPAGDRQPAQLGSRQRRGPHSPERSGQHRAPDCRGKDGRIRRT